MNLTALPLILCSLTFQLHANDNHLLLAEQAMKHGNFLSAFEKLQPLNDQYAGVEKFDHLFGITALETKHYSLAVFALERLLFIKPEDAIIQANLALAYVALNEYEKAYQLIDKIKQQPLNSIYQTNLAEKINRISKPSNKHAMTISGLINVSFGHDNNITNGPRANFITLPAASDYGALPVGEGLEQRSGSFSLFSTGVQMTKPLSSTFSIQSGINASQRLNTHLNSENIGALSFWVGSTKTNNKQLFSANISQQNITLDNSTYRKKTSLNTRFTHMINQDKQLSISLSGGQLKYPDAATQNADLGSLGATLYQQFQIKFKPQLSVSLTGRLENVKDEDNGYLGYKGLTTKLSSLLTLNQTNKLSINLTFDHREYSDKDPFYFANRIDNSFILGSSLTHKLKYYQKISLIFNALLIRNSSNLNLYDYKRSTASAGFQINW